MENRKRSEDGRSGGRNARLAAGMAAAAVLAASALLGGCGRGERGDYAEARKDIADQFPIQAEAAGENPQLAASDGPYAVLHTTAGDITILLYEKEAPETVKNFVALAREGYYDGSLFFYVKKGELAQTGKPAVKEETNPSGGPVKSGEERSSTGSPIPDEFHDGLHNFPGAVGMAGLGEDQNLSQFYFTVSQEKPEDDRVVSASFYVNELMRQATEELNRRGKEAALSEEEVRAFEEELNRKIQSINTEGIPEEYSKRYQPAVEQYRKTGGIWGLDYKQTVFGQIVEGLNVAEAITQVKVNAADRSPRKEILIQSIEILDSLE